MNAKTLTFSLGDGGRGRDGAEGGTAWVGRVSPGHGHGVTDPCCRVNGSDRLICRVRKTIRKQLLTQTWIRVFCVSGRAVRTARQSEVALRRRVPALCHCEDDGPGKEYANITTTVRSHRPR